MTVLYNFKESKILSLGLIFQYSVKKLEILNNNKKIINNRYIVSRVVHW